MPGYKTTAARICFILMFRFGTHEQWTISESNLDFGTDMNYKHTYELYVKHIVS